MRSVCSVCGLLLLSASLDAQQPSVRTRLGTIADPSGPVRGWALASDPETETDLAPLVEGRGPGVRIHATSDLTIVKSEWPLSGTFTVSALIQRPSESAAVYGLTVGAKDALNPGMAFLVRTDGAFSIGPVAGSRNWRAMTAFRPAAPDGAAADRLEVRVSEAGAEFLLNGVRLAVTRVDAGALDGRAGVYVAGGTDVIVSAFSMEAAPELLRPGAR
jgi:hypothetical protein